jgi:hypothetical protein
MVTVTPLVLTESPYYNSVVKSVEHIISLSEIFSHGQMKTRQKQVEMITKNTYECMNSVWQKKEFTVYIYFWNEILKKTMVTWWKEK